MAHQNYQSVIQAREHLASFSIDTLPIMTVRDELKLAFHGIETSTPAYQILNQYSINGNVNERVSKQEVLANLDYAGKELFKQ